MATLSSAQELDVYIENSDRVPECTGDDDCEDMECDADETPACDYSRCRCRSSQASGAGGSTVNEEPENAFDIWVPEDENDSFGGAPVSIAAGSPSAGTGYKESLEVETEAVPHENEQDATGPEVHVPEAGKVFTVRMSAEATLLESNGVEASTSSELTLIGEGVAIKTESDEIELGILPDVAVQEARSAGVSEAASVELKIVDEEPVYEIGGTKEGRFLGIFPVVMNIKVTIDASTGETLELEKPWWSFIVL